MISIDKIKPVMVTGATGYVAGRLVEKLLSEGITVHAAVRDPENKNKTQYLDALAEKLPGSIKYFKTDLLSEGSYDEAMNNCELVFHTASPFSLSVKNSQLDLVDPAKKGTRNVLESANRTESVKRVVVTSSCAAIYGDAVDTLIFPNQELTEDLWNTTSTLEHQPYSFSKVEAEKEAWKIQKEQSRWDLITINPSFVLGPGINPFGTSESFDIMKQIGNGDFKMGAPEFNTGAVDVRDLAEAHFQAGFRPEAKGRYITSGINSSFGEIAGYIKKSFPNYKISSRKLPKFMIWLMAPSVGMTRKMVSKNV
ncbi:MAG: NAD-dependent epimerase/dehydratase family protein, partial [Crocinitomicaceae bacterium]|nr:NAD-dependent epimerase/dehydratase family protein [Crocinitomicaceae bacterium]